MLDARRNGKNLCVAIDLYNISFCRETWWMMLAACSAHHWPHPLTWSLFHRHCQFESYLSNTFFVWVDYRHCRIISYELWSNRSNDEEWWRTQNPLWLRRRKNMILAKTVGRRMTPSKNWVCASECNATSSNDYIITYELHSPEFGCPLLFGRADGAPSRASTSSAYAPCFSRSNTILVKISPLCKLISKNSLPSLRGESTM